MIDTESSPVSTKLIFPYNTDIPQLIFLGYQWCQRCPAFADGPGHAEIEKEKGKKKGGKKKKLLKPYNRRTVILSTSSYFYQTYRITYVCVCVGALVVVTVLIPEVMRLQMNTGGKGTRVVSITNDGCPIHKQKWILYATKPFSN